MTRPASVNPFQACRCGHEYRDHRIWNFDSNSVETRCRQCDCKRVDHARRGRTQRNRVYLVYYDM